MKRISPMDKVGYARLFTAMQRSEDKEELREYAKSMRDCAAKLEAKAQELEKREQWAKENKNNSNSQFRY